jgi:hypothetical protein
MTQVALALSKNLEGSWLELGKVLVEIREHGYHKVLGYPNFRDFINNHNFGFRDRKAYNLMRMAEYPFIAKIQHLPHTKCVSLCSIDDEKTLDEILEKIDSLNEQEFLEAVKRNKIDYVDYLRNEKSRLMKVMNEALFRINSIEKELSEYDRSRKI